MKPYRRLTLTLLPLTPMKHTTKLLGIFLAAAALVAMSAYHQRDDDKPALRSGIITQNMDLKVKPGDNFTAYVNGNWMKQTPIPADKSTYGTGSMVRDQAEENVKAIIEASASGKFAPGSEEQKIGDFYQAYLNRKVRDSLGLSPLKPEFRRIEAIASYKDLASYLAYANKLGNLVPLTIGVNEDFKDPPGICCLPGREGSACPNGNIIC